jgi:hypothetical protein
MNKSELIQRVADKNDSLLHKVYYKMILLKHEDKEESTEPDIFDTIKKKNYYY